MKRRDQESGVRSQLAGVARPFLTLGPAHRDHLPAGRIALGVAVPLVLLLGLGHLNLIVYAAFAAFTGIYARHEPLGTRLRHQVVSAALLLACLSAGWALAQAGTGPWGVALAGALAAGVGAVLAAALGLRPAGSLFFVFAVTTAASTPPPPFALALGVAAGSAALSVGLGVVGALFSERVRPNELAAPPPNRLSEEDLAWHGLRHLIAAGLGGVAGVLIGLGHTPWAMVAAVAPISAQDQRGRVQRALERMVGTLLGVLVAAPLLALGLPVWAKVVAVVLLQFLAELFAARNYSLTLLFVTPLALLLTTLGHPAPAGPILLARAVETVLGALIGLGVVLLVRSAAEQRAAA
ncbi:FUSC family protein [Deinococcus sp. KSM4-11]|uniref:FUSC family protein n=1 Tax=Deinococcus sp. KSM4-11 TaxID=2568654 RepID=UPI0010A5051A|nr:FUSC family protein [Deinococcus sp. KSM4-11]THF85259.1 FUSC family protein [Deinococcus sp. KSM4-11]